MQGMIIISIWERDSKELYAHGLVDNRLNSPNNTAQKDQFWTSTTIRNKNIIAPEKFSGGTASAPQLGPRAL